MLAIINAPPQQSCSGALSETKGTMMAKQVKVTPALEEISKGRDHINTKEFAKAMNCAPQTARKNYCLTGYCFGIRPIKIGNKLLWSVADISHLLNGEA